MQKRGVSRLFVRKFRVAKNFMHKKGISLKCVEKSLSHSADKIRRRTLLCFERILVSKIFKQRRGEALRFSRKFFHLTGPKKRRQGTILCFRKFLVGKNILWIRGGGYHDCPSKFLSHCTEIFHWGTLWCFRKFLSSKIFMHSRGGITVLSKLFVSQDRNEKFCKGTLLFSGNFLVSKKFKDKRVHITIFNQNFYVSQCRRISWTSLQCFRKFGASKNFMHTREYHNLPSKIFCLTVAKNIVKELLSVSLISGIKKS